MNLLNKNFSSQGLTAQQIEKQKEFIGRSSFIMSCNDKLEYGVIKKISPMFLKNDKKQILVKTPFNGSFDNNKIEGEPTDDYTLAYLDYDTFNKYYKDLFGEDFDLNKQDKGNTTYDKEYVYYRNRRAGSNNVYVPIIKAISVEYKNNKYIADIEVTYSTRASELIGVPKSNGTITYTKNIDNNILLEDFIINK